MQPLPRTEALPGTNRRWAEPISTTAISPPSSQQIALDRGQCSQNVISIIDVDHLTRNAPAH